MTDEKFPSETCSWPPASAEQGERWLAALEKQGPDNVRARLALTQAAPRASIAIGTESSVTAGFAQEWLAWSANATGAVTRIGSNVQNVPLLGTVPREG
jgi:hypothetical protein